MMMRRRSNNVLPLILLSVGTRNCPKDQSCRRLRDANLDQEEAGGGGGDDEGEGQN